MLGGDQLRLFQSLAAFLLLGRGEEVVPDVSSFGDELSGSCFEKLDLRSP